MCCSERSESRSWAQVTFRPWLRLKTARFRLFSLRYYWVGVLSCQAMGWTSPVYSTKEKRRCLRDSPPELLTNWRCLKLGPACPSVCSHPSRKTWRWATTVGNCSTFSDSDTAPMWTAWCPLPDPSRCVRAVSSPMWASTTPTKTSRRTRYVPGSRVTLVVSLWPGDIFQGLCLASRCLMITGLVMSGQTWIDTRLRHFTSCLEI